MRNRQAQYIPASSTKLGLIEPIDSKYAFMAQPKRPNRLMVKPGDSETALFMQSIDYNSRLAKYENEYQQTIDDLVNTASSMPGGIDAFLTSQDPNTVRLKNEFEARIKSLNNEKILIDSSVSTLKSNKAKWDKEANEVDPTQIAVTNDGLQFIYDASNKDGEVKMKMASGDPFAILDMTSELNPNPIKINASDVFTTQDYRNYINETYQLFDEKTGSINTYNGVKNIDQNKGAETWKNLFQENGAFSVFTSKGIGATGGAIKTSMNEFKQNGGDIQQVFQTVKGVLTPGSNMVDNNTQLYLLNEYINDVKNNVVIPRMYLKSPIEGWDKMTDEQLSNAIMKVDKTKPFFEIEYRKDANGKTIYEKPGQITKEGYMSWLVNKTVKTANPQLDLNEKTGTEAVSSATDASYGIDKSPKQMNEFDTYITEGKSFMTNSNTSLMGRFKNTSFTDNMKTCIRRYAQSQGLTDNSLFQELDKNFEGISEVSKNYQDWVNTMQQTSLTPQQYKEAQLEAIRYRGLAVGIAKNIRDMIYKKYPKSNNQATETLNKIYRKFADDVFQKFIFGDNYTNNSANETVDAFGTFRTFKKDQTVHSGNEFTDEVYLTNGLLLKNATNIDFIKFSPDCYKFNEPYTVNGKSIKYGDATTSDAKNAFFISAQKDVSGKYYGNATTGHYLVKKTELPEYITVVDATGNYIAVSRDKAMTDPRYSKQLGFVNTTTLEGVNPEGWTKVKSSDKYKDQNLKDDYIVVIGLWYDLSNYGKTSTGGFAPISGNTR